MEEVPGSEKFFKAQLVFLALGFLGPEQDMLKSLQVKLDGRGNIQTPSKVRFSRTVVNVTRSSRALPNRNTRRIFQVSSPLVTVAVGSLLSSGESSMLPWYSSLVRTLSHQIPYFQRGPWCGRRGGCVPQQRLESAAYCRRFQETCTSDTSVVEVRQGLCIDALATLSDVLATSEQDGERYR